MHLTVTHHRPSIQNKYSGTSIVITKDHRMGLAKHSSAPAPLGGGALAGLEISAHPLPQTRQCQNCQPGANHISIACLSSVCHCICELGCLKHLLARRIQLPITACQQQSPIVMNRKGQGHRNFHHSGKLAA